MTEKKNKNRLVEIRVEIDDVKICAVPNTANADLDQLLERRNAHSFVFIPLSRFGKRRNRKPGMPARQKKKLPEGDWYDGELRSKDDDKSVPGVLAFDIRRRQAREIAEALGVKQFFWGTTGTSIEQHAVEVFKAGDSHSWKTVRMLAFQGLADMLAAARNISSLPTAVKESQTDMQRFWQLCGVVLGISITAGVLQSIAFSMLGSDDSTSWLTSMIKVFFYPFIIPAVLVGIYLRVLGRKGEEEGRDFTAAEAEENWHKVAPHLLALWALCWTAVLLLTWVQTVPSTELPFIGRTNGVMTSFIVCVWMLLPIANSRSVETLFSSAFEAAIAAAVSIFTIKLSLYVTNLMTDFLWGIVISMVPFEIPERLQEIISAIINFGAEVFFMAVLLGYAWSRTRQQFTRL